MTLDSSRRTTIGHRVRQLVSDADLRQLGRNVIVLLSGDVGAAIFLLAAAAVAVRALGTEQFGQLVLINAYAHVFAHLFGFQSWKGLIKFGAEHQKRGDRHGFCAAVNLAGRLDLIGALAGMTAGILLAKTIGGWFGWSPAVIEMAQLYSLVVLFQLTGMPTGVLRLFGAFRAFAIRTVVAGAVKLAGALLAAMAGADLWGFVIVWIITDLAGRALILFSGLRLLVHKDYGDWWRTGVGDWKPMTAFSLWVNLSSAIALPMKRLDVFIIGAVISIEAVGLYSVIRQFSEVFTRFVDAVYQVIFPRFATQIADSNAPEALRTVIHVGVFILLLSVPSAFVASLTSPWWLVPIYGSAFSSAIVPLAALLLFRAVWAAFAGVYPLFVALGHVKLDALLALLSRLLYIAAAVGLGSTFGLLGIVAATALCFAFLVTIRLVVITRSVGRVQGQAAVDPAGSSS